MTGQIIESIIRGKDREAALRLLDVCTRAKDIKLGLDVISRRFCIEPQSLLEWYQDIVCLEGTLAHILKPSHRQAGLSLQENGQTVCLKRGTEILKEWKVAEVAIAEMLREADRCLQ